MQRVEHDLPHVTLHACVGCGNVSHDADTWSCEGPCHVLREGDAYEGPCAWIDGHEDTAPVEYVSVVEADGEAGLLAARCRGAAESLRHLADLLDAPDDNGSA